MKGKTATGENAQSGGESSRDFQRGLLHNPTQRSRKVRKEIHPFSFGFGSIQAFLVIGMGDGEKLCCYTLCNLASHRKDMKLKHP